MGLAHLCCDAKRRRTYAFKHWREIQRQDIVAMCELRLHWYSLTSRSYAVYHQIRPQPAK